MNEDRIGHHERIRGRLLGLVIQLEARLTAQQQTWAREFLDANELGLALEMLADWLSEDSWPITAEERATMLDLVAEMGMDDRVARAIELCPDTGAASTALIRCWIDFDLAELQPEEPPSGVVRLDGGSPAFRLLERGIGVTGYNTDDCLALVARALRGEVLPPVAAIRTDVDVSKPDVAELRLGNPAWRGIWFPAINLSGPST